MSDLAKPPFVVLRSKKGENDRIKLTEGQYSGIIFSYGKVEFEEVGDTLKIKFVYDVHDDAGIDYDEAEFEKYLGDFLQELIYYGIEQNDITYTGGVDENRTGDPIEPDSQ